MSIENILGYQLEPSVDALKQVFGPIETARGLPNACYTEPASIEAEQRRLFGEGWVCAGFVTDVPSIGDLFPFEFSGLPLFMVRGVDSVIRVFHNVCSHRGRILVEEPKTVKKSVVCPYHSWSYGLEGELISSPHIGGPGKHSCPYLDKHSVALSKVRSAEWFNLVFIDLSGLAPEFSEYISPVVQRWKEFEGIPLVHTGVDSTITLEIDCNWKLAIENYCEAYHLPWVHPNLNSYSPLESHYSIVGENFSGQGSDSYSPSFSHEVKEFPTAPGLPSFWETRAEYIALYPNVLLGIHRDHFYAVLITPEGSRRTHERLKIFYYDEAVRKSSFDAAREANRKQWQSIFLEDRSAVESMQRGRQSPGFKGGVFSPVMEQTTHAFHAWVARALLEGRGSKVATFD